MFLQADSQNLNPNMKKVILALCVVLAGVCVYFIAQPSASEPAIESFRLVAWDNANDGTICQESGMVEVRHISSGKQVMNVDYILSPGSEITPDPKSLIEKWPEKVTFTVKNQGKTKDYTVVLADFVSPDDQPQGPDWKIMWNDEFNSTSIDTMVWSKTPRTQSHWARKMTDAEDLYEMKDGKLFLYGKKNLNHPEDTIDHLTGGIWGRDKKCFAIGRVDVRAKMTPGKGFWPAIWLLPQGNDKPYSEGGELDMMERLNFDNFAYQTMHTRYTNLVNRANPKNYTTHPINVDDYNTYSVIVTTEKVQYLINNEVTHEYPNLGIEYQFPFASNAYYVVLSSQLGGDWVGEIDLKGETVYMSIDWVRVYTKK